MDELRRRIGLIVYWECRPELWSSDMKKTIDNLADLFQEHGRAERLDELRGLLAHKVNWINEQQVLHVVVKTRNIKQRIKSLQN